MKKQRMSKNRIQLLICQDTTTPESREFGDFESSEVLSETVYRIDEIDQLACDMAYKIVYDGIGDSNDGIAWLSSEWFTQCYATGTAAQDSMHLNFGANLDDSAIKDQIVALVRHYLITRHNWAADQAKKLQA